MAMYRYFNSVDKLPKLPDPTGSLSKNVPSSSIILANGGVKNWTEESCLRRKKGYIKLSPDVDGRFINIGLFFTWQLLTSSLPAANPRKFCPTKKSRHLVCRQLLQHVNKCFTFSTVHKISPRVWASIKVTRSSSSCLFMCTLVCIHKQTLNSILGRCLWTPLQHVS